ARHRQCATRALLAWSRCAHCSSPRSVASAGRYPVAMYLSRNAVLEFHACLHECLDIIINHIAPVPDAILTREVHGFGHPTLRDQIAHILSTETAWISGL